MKILTIRNIFITLLLPASFMLVSCGDWKKVCPPRGAPPDNAAKPDNAVKKYVDKLAGAPDKAKDAAKAGEQRNKAQEDALKGL